MATKRNQWKNLHLFVSIYIELAQRRFGSFYGIPKVVNRDYRPNLVLLKQTNNFILKQL